MTYGDAELHADHLVQLTALGLGEAGHWEDESELV